MSTDDLSPENLSDDQLREYAKTLILDHARGVEFLTIFEMAEGHCPGGKISDADANEIDGLISRATITVEWPEVSR